jgi:hypothetical protein
MTEDELSAIVESKLADRHAARLQADRERIRMEVIRELRREEERKWYARINAKHPIETAGDPKAEAARVAAMRVGAARDAEHMARVNSRPVEGSLVHQRKRVASRMEVIRELRREEERKWYARINAKHPIETAGDPNRAAALMSASPSISRP